MDAVPLKRSRSIEILEFVRAGEIEPIYFDKPYYIEPEEGAEKAYALLRETLERLEKYYNGKGRVVAFQHDK